MLTLMNYKPIGKAVLHRAIGLADNYVQNDNVRILSPNIPERCTNCDIYKTRCAFSDFPQSEQYKEAAAVCLNCPYGKALEINTVIKPKLIADEKKRYINEKNRYGYAKRLKLHSILLFIAYHLIVSSDNGIIRNVSVSDLADLLHCSRRAIRYNNHILESNGYIYLSSGVDGDHVNVCLPEYRTYFLPAKEGGRGFFTLSKDLFDSLCEIKQTTALRIVLKTILSMDNDPLSAMQDAHMESYVQIRRYLPSYCKRNVVKSALNRLSSSIFHIKTEHKFVEFRLNRKFDTKNIKRRMREQNDSMFRQLIDSINRIIKIAPADKEQIMEQLRNIDFPLSISNVSTDKLRQLKLSDDDLQSMTTLSLEYTYDLVKSALNDIYQEYILSDTPVRNLGAMLRSVLRRRSGVNSISEFSTAF